MELEWLVQVYSINLLDYHMPSKITDLTYFLVMFDCFRKFFKLALVS